MKKLAFLLTLVVATPAWAQHHQEVPQHGEGGEGHEAAGAGHHDDGDHGDPSLHFNWTDGLDLSYKEKNQNGGKLQQGQEAMSVPFVLVLLNFGILMILIGWKGAPLARQMATKRSDEIKGALDEAARLRAQAKAKLDEYSSKLRAAEGEIDDLIKTMKADAEAERQRIIAAAEVQAALLRKDAELQIAAEIERARGVLQREVVAAADQIAERLLREQTTAADHKQLVETFIQEVAS